MNKNSKYLLIACIIAFIAGSVIAFLLVEEKNAQFWISYVAATLALGFVFAGGTMNSKDTKTPSAFAFSSLSVFYLIAVAIIIIAGHKMHFGAFLYASVHIAALAIFLIVSIATHAGHSYIVQQGEETKRQVIKARMDVERAVSLLASAEDLPEDIKAAAKQAIAEVEDKLRYSDPMQSPETAVQAADVESALDKLEMLFDDLSAGRCAIDDFSQQAKIAVRKIDAYNRAKKLLK